MVDAGFFDSLAAEFHQGSANASVGREEQENFRVVERVYGSIAGDDFASLADHMAEDVTLEIIGPPGALFTGTHRGRDQVIEATRSNFALLQDQRPEVLSVAARGDTVVVVGKEVGRFRATGIDYEVYWMQVFTLRERKVTSIRERLGGASVPMAADALGPAEAEVVETLPAG